MSASGQGRPLRRADVWKRTASHENSIYDPQSGRVFLLNETALAIWELCDGDTIPDEMTETISTASGLPAEVVGEDVDRTLDRLAEIGLITWR